MTAKLSPVDRYDAIDREEFRQVVENEHFRAIMARIEQDLKRHIDTCVRSDNQVEIYRSQGAAAALKVAIETPARMLDEINRRLSGK